MPTIHVESTANDHLQEVANVLLKARKVVVVTGAGISTNSGIPDFRSKNGLYSLIQSNYDNAAAAVRQNPERSFPLSGEEDGSDSAIDGRSAKRRRLSRTDSDETVDDETDMSDSIVEATSTLDRVECYNVEIQTASTDYDSSLISPSTADTITRATSPACTLPLSRISPMSSLPPEDLLAPLPNLITPEISVRQTRARSRLLDVAFPPTSSPLSSPPPVLFDPFEPNSPTSSCRSSTSQSDVEDTAQAEPLASQLSGAAVAKITLPHMKGKDLFDVSVWADPLKTSVFYRFTTSLRQKSKHCEPTGSHRFIGHLRDRGKLVRCYTQNIDQLEEKVGLSTSLEDGPGRRGRFSRKSTTNSSQLSKMVEEAKDIPTTDNSTNNNNQNETPADTTTPSDVQTSGDFNPPRQSSCSGVECVFLHGSLERLRCFLCQQVCSWDDAREMETLLGEQPECPHCLGTAVAREKEGKRALGVGRLRPDIVLYGEEHPKADLIGPIITHDLSLSPDMLLILGTSLRVHGLKIMVREFAKSIHNRGGKVVFVNHTKPPESEWAEIIDYWIQWDCDAWVSNLQTRVPGLWEAPAPPREKQPAKNPVAFRDTRITGAYCTQKIIGQLFRLTGTDSLLERASQIPPEPCPKRSNSKSKGKATVAKAESSLTSSSTETETEPEKDTGDEIQQLKPDPVQTQSSDKAMSEIEPGLDPKKTKARPKRSRKSAPGLLEAPKKKRASTLNPNHGRATKANSSSSSAAALLENDAAADMAGFASSLRPSRKVDGDSILRSVKENPRTRKPKIRYGEEEVTRPRIMSKPPRRSESDLTLAPLNIFNSQAIPQPDLRPRPVEPLSPPAGPLPILKANISPHQAAGTADSDSPCSSRGVDIDSRNSVGGVHPLGQEQDDAFELRPDEREAALTMTGILKHWGTRLFYGHPPW